MSQPARKRRRKSRFASTEDAAPSLPPADAQPTTTPTPPKALLELRQRILAAKSKPSSEQEPQNLQQDVKKESEDAKPPTQTKKRRRSRFASVVDNEQATLSPPASSLPLSQTKPPTNEARIIAGKSAAVSEEMRMPMRVDINSIPVAPVSTLRINRAKAHKKKLDNLKVSKADLLSTNPEQNPYFDQFVTSERKRVLSKTISFVEPGKHTKQAEKKREHEAAKRRKDEYNEGIISGTTDGLPPYEAPSYRVPDVEWWDKPFLEDGNITEKSITKYIHHPVPIAPSKEKKETVIPLMLTKKETKKLRRQRRMEKHKEEVEMIQMGVMAPPKPKVKLSNMVRVLANEATKDPTAVEKEVRQQVEERRVKHEMENAARKKSAEEKREKAREKIEDDRDKGVHSAVYRIRELNTKQKFKVDVSAKQAHLTGACVILGKCNIVVVEGGLKMVRKFKKLMLRRIDWKTDDESNDCVLIWEGPVASASFEGFRSLTMKSEAEVRDYFRRNRVEHYWDLCTQSINLKAVGVRQLE